MKIGENIKKLRLELKLTQESLAAAVGVSGQAISKWECEESLARSLVRTRKSVRLRCTKRDFRPNISVTVGREDEKKHRNCAIRFKKCCAVGLHA